MPKTDKIVSSFYHHLNIINRLKKITTNLRANSRSNIFSFNLKLL